MKFDSPLPIDDVLDRLRAALREGARAVLVAPPGAGKTTRVPLALLDEPWLQGGKILVLEPRRIAARGAAERMAATLGEEVGQTIGLRARLATKVGPATRIEVVTEGVFTRLILADPELCGIAAVLFDEFHERSLDADFGLALALDAAAGLRPDLRILPMSATLDGARVAALLGDAPVIESLGRAFPVATRYLGRDSVRRIEDEVTDACMKALAADPGSMLVFLPGQGEITRVAERLAERLRGRDGIVLAPLYGALDRAEQDAALRPARPGTRKIVLATSIAETSITIEGVRIVIDSGLAREPRYEPDVGVTRLVTVRVSRASADQRRGRAGRTEPGICYRLWDEPQTQSLLPYAEPEIRVADLSGLVLDCAEWGAEARTLSWLDPPSSAAVQAARDELTDLAALDADGRITALGKRFRALPLPPRLARMVIAAGELGAARDAADIAAVLVERGLGGGDVDIETRLAAFRRDRASRSSDMRRLAESWARAARAHPGAASPPSGEASVGGLLALAYPDRIAKARGAAGNYLLVNGRAAAIEATHALAREPFLVVAEMAGAAAATRILAAATLTEAEVVRLCADRIRSEDEITFDAAAAALRARRSTRLGAIRLTSEPRPVAADERSAHALAAGLAALGIARLPWSKAQAQLRDRVAFLRTAADDGWPDLSDAQLAATATEWLAPFLVGKSRLADIGADDLAAALDALLPWDLKRRLETDAPTHYEAPTGNRHAIDYEGAGAPARPRCTSAGRNSTV
ncbi:MAG: ATP-dependent helicase HrpB [Beijerinckiaceae bacterium]|nr:ATP-dependent helicase HrpB [Beijerinckiaceae bacterium]